MSRWVYQNLIMIYASLASQPLRLRRKGLVNCQQATCNSLQESCSPIRLQENLLIIFMEHKMASKRVEMLFAKKLFV